MCLLSLAMPIAVRGSTLLIANGVRVEGRISLECAIIQLSTLTIAPYAAISKKLIAKVQQGLRLKAGMKDEVDSIIKAGRIF